MSYFGKNIKKIRSIKGLSQQAFADIFNLKRGTLGAYEEERSEPKIETLLKIANYFSISLDDLLTTDLTVNKLLSFNGEITTQVEKVKRQPFAIVPCITTEQQDLYPNHFSSKSFIEELPILHLPLDKTSRYRGLTISNLEMTNHDKGFYPNDIVIGEFIPLNDFKKINTGTLVFAVLDQSVICRKFYLTKNDIVLRADHRGIEDIRVSKEDIKELWEVKYVFCKRIPEFSDNIENQLVVIQNELTQIKNKLN